MVGVATGSRFLASAPMDLDLLCKGQQTAFDVFVSHFATLKDSTVESSLIKAVIFMQDFFLLRFKHRKLPSSSIPQKSCGVESASRMKGGDLEQWEGEAYTVYINLLLELMIKEGVSSSVHVRLLTGFLISPDYDRLLLFPFDTPFVCFDRLSGFNSRVSL